MVDDDSLSQGQRCDFESMMATEDELPRRYWRIDEGQWRLLLVDGPGHWIVAVSTSVNHHCMLQECQWYAS
eukprot:877202-Amphidinium_carterae.1